MNKGKGRVDLEVLGKGGGGVVMVVVGGCPSTHLMKSTLSPLLECEAPEKKTARQRMSQIVM